MKKALAHHNKAPDLSPVLDLERDPLLLRQILEASGVAMSIRDRNLKPIFANQAFLDFYDYSLTEISSLSIEALLPKKTSLLYCETIQPSMLAGKGWEGEYAIRTKAGRKRLVWGRFDPVFDDKGVVTHILTLMHDASTSQRLRNALDQTERHLQFLSENTGDCLFRLRLSDGRYDYISSAVTTITGYPPQTFYETPRLLEQLVPKEWDETFKGWWKELLTGETQQKYEFPLIHKDGSKKWINQRVSMVKDYQGTPIAIEGIFTEVTERRQAEEKLDIARKSLNFISNSTSDIFFRMTIPEGRYDYLSPSVERFSGYSLEEYEKNPLLIKQLFPPDWADYFQETWKELLQGIVRPEYEFQYIHKSGETRWARQRVVLHKDDDGNPIAIEGIATDATAHKAAEEALRARERQYRLLTETIEDVIWTMDKDLHYTYVSPAITQLVGYTPEEYCRMDLAETMTKESLRTVMDTVALKNEAEAQGEGFDVKRLEIERIHKDGSSVWVESIARSLLDDDGNHTGYLGITRDTTLRKKWETRIRQNETRFRTLFEDSPISLWEEDLTRLKAYFDKLKAQGVTDFRQHFYDTPKDLEKCALLVDVVDVNKATLDMLKARNKEELLGNLDKVLTKSSMAAFTEEMILLASGGSEYCGEITHRTLEGDIIWVVVHFSVPPEYQDTLSRVIVSLLDVTPRKRAEQALMDSEERYRVLVENAQEGVVVTQNGESKYINEGMTNILGYTNEELKQIHPLEMIHPKDRSTTLGQFKGLISGSRKDGITSFRILTKDNHVKWLTLTTKPIMWEGRKAQLEILTDVTIHKALEEELRTAYAETENRIKKRTKELSLANTQLTKEAEEREKAQQRILSLTQQLIRVQEDERQRIARDLHDNVAQDLSSLMLQMETFFDGYSSAKDELLERSEAVARILKRSIASVRDIAYELRPPALDQLGLINALENHCQDVGRRADITVDFHATGIESLRLEFDTKINMYRMVQEAVANTVKHAHASQATVRMVKSHPDILIRIEDNGRGFEVEKRMAEVVEEKRMGLKSMEERARLIGGSMEIQSLIGTGTRIIFKIPIQKTKKEESHGHNDS